MSLTEPNHRRLSVVYQDVNALNPRITNPRSHSKKQIVQIANAIGRFGFTNPVLVDDANGIIAGHGRVEGAKVVGLDQVPTVRLSDLSEAEIRADGIADNRLAENAGWDRALLGLELQYLTELEIDFDVTVTGFELPEIDLLIGELSLAANDNDAADAVVEVAPGPAMCRFPATLADSARSSTASLPWHPVKCRRPSLRRSCSLYSAISRPILWTARFISSAWAGAIARK